MNFFYFRERKSRLIHTEKLLLPQTKKMAQKYCSFLCSQYGMCEYFMTTKTTPCSYGCNQIGNKCKYKIKMSCYF